MSQNTKKPYDLPDWPAEAEQTQEAPRPRRKRRAPAEPEDLWGKLRFRAGKKVRWFGRRCRRVVREVMLSRSFRTVSASDLEASRPNTCPS